MWLESIGVISGCFPHKTYISLLHLYLVFFCSSIPTSFFILLKYIIQQWVISVEGRRGTYPLLSPACSDFNHNYYNYAELRR